MAGTKLVKPGAGVNWGSEKERGRKLRGTGGDWKDVPGPPFFLPLLHPPPPPRIPLHTG